MTTIVPILLYHSIANDASPRFRRWTLTPSRFATHMTYLRDRAYTPTTVSGLARLIADRTALWPDRPVAVTFDDGYEDFYLDALPVLAALHFPATIYVTTGFVGATSRWLYREGEGDRSMLSWAQISEIRDQGVECGAHSVHHFQLDTLPREAGREEIARSKQDLEQHLGSEVCTFAYPHGYYSTTVRELVHREGFTSACAVKHAMSAPTDDPFALARIVITSETTVDDLAKMLVGDGLRIAPSRTAWSTKAWQAARQTSALLRRTLPERARAAAR